MGTEKKVYIGRVQRDDTGNEGRVQSRDTKEENIERVRSGSRGEASTGKVQDAEEKAIWCCEGSKKGREERI